MRTVASMGYELCKLTPRVRVVSIFPYTLKVYVDKNDIGTINKYVSAHGVIQAEYIVKPLRFYERWMKPFYKFKVKKPFSMYKKFDVFR